MYSKTHYNIFSFWTLFKTVYCPSSKSYVEVVATKDGNHPHYLPRPDIHPCRRGQAEGARWQKISIALLSLSISLCPGNVKLWQGASLPPTAPSCERDFPIQAIYMVFWPLCDQALANYLLSGGQNPGFSVQYWNQLAGKKPYCKDVVRKKINVFPLQTFLWSWPATLLFSIILGMWSAIHSAAVHILHWATRPDLVQKSGDPISFLPALLALKEMSQFLSL